MGRHDAVELLRSVRSAIARLTESCPADERTIARALAHLWSAHDELESLVAPRVVSRAS